MATKTRAQLVEEAADCLLLTGNGQALDSDDSEKIDGQVDALIEQLSADDVVDIPDLAEIEVRFFKALGELLANASATKFGIPYSPDKKMVFEAQLKKTAASKPTYEAQKVDYF